MRIVLLAQAFPPHPEVGAVRAQSLVSALVEAGHSVTVVTERVPKAEYPAPDQGDGLRLIPVDVGLPYAQRVHRLTRFLHRRKRDADRGGETASANTLSTPPSAEGLRGAVTAILSVPDPAQHLVLPFARAGLRAIRDGADLLYTSAPPFSIHLAGLLVRRLRKITWAAEFRDPWLHPWTERLAPRHPLSRGVDAFWERRVLRRADALVMGTEPARDFIATRLPPASRGKLLVALNGIPGSGFGRGSASTRTGRYTILHAGSLYLNRNPMRFLKGLSIFVSRNGLVPSDLAVQFIGRSREYNGVSISALLGELGLAEFVHFEDWLPRAEVGARMAAADALLLFAQQQPLQVPNKLYEYLAVEVPILALLDRDGASARVLGETGGAELLYDPEPLEVAAALERLFRHPEGSEPERSVAELAARRRFSTRAQMAGLVAELEKRFATGRSRGSSPSDPSTHPEGHSA